MKLWESYHLPNSVDEALALLKDYAGEARVIAGGTDLLVERRAERAEPLAALVDISAIPALNTIEMHGGEVTIGAGVSHTAIVKSESIARRATCLVESCGVIGGPQVRNVATLGGNVAHALPAGDGTTSLVALDAEAEIIQEGERRWVPILAMYRGPGQSLLDPTRDLLMRFRFTLNQPEREATAFKRIMRPQGVALPILGCAIWVRLSEDHSHYEDVRICMAPVGPTPRRAEAVEEALRGQGVNDETLASALHVAHETLQPRTSKYRATAEYRQEMIDILLRRTLKLAVQRVQTGDVIPEGIGGT